jgi:hypothetical protein
VEAATTPEPATAGELEIWQGMVTNTEAKLANERELNARMRVGSSEWDSSLRAIAIDEQELAYLRDVIEARREGRPTPASENDWLAAKAEPDQVAAPKTGGVGAPAPGPGAALPKTAEAVQPGEPQGPKAPDITAPKQPAGGKAPLKPVATGRDYWNEWSAPGF